MVKSINTSATMTSKYSIKVPNWNRIKGTDLD